MRCQRSRTAGGRRGRSSTALAAAALAALLALGGAAFWLLRPPAALEVLDASARADEPAQRAAQALERTRGDDGERVSALAPAAGLREPGADDAPPGDGAAPCVVSVRAEDGLPVTGALVLAAARLPARRAEPGDAAVLAVSDAAGVALLADGACARALRVVVSHDLHLPAEATLGGAGPHVVVLARGHEQRFVARTTAGEPVPRYVVRMSRSALAPGPAFIDPTAPEPAGAPSASSARAVHAARSEADGSARIAGLSDGLYAYEVIAERGMVPVRIGRAALPPETATALRATTRLQVGSAQLRETVPGEPIEITFAPVYVVAFEPLGDEIVACWFRSQEPWLTSGLAASLLRHEQRALADAFPRAGVLVATLTGPFENPPVAELLLRRTGAQQPELRAVPLGEFTAPELLDCSAFPDTPLHEVGLNAYDHEHRPIGREALGDTLVLAKGDVTFGPDSFFPDERGTWFVPDGSYRVAATPQHLAHAFTATPAKIAPPATVEVTFDVALRRCRLEYLPPWGEPVADVDWKIQTSRGQVRVHARDGEPATAILPVGEATAFAQAFGVTSDPTQIAVLPGTWDEIQLIRIVAE